WDIARSTTPDRPSLWWRWPHLPFLKPSGSIAGNNDLRSQWSTACNPERCSGLYADEERGSRHPGNCRRKLSSCNECRTPGDRSNVVCSTPEEPHVLPVRRGKFLVAKPAGPD